MDKIEGNYILFFGEDDFSNFSSHEVKAEGETFRTGEHYFHWLKAMFFGDEETAGEILHAETARDAKALGRKVRNYVDSKWNAVRKTEMLKVLRAKVESNPDLMDRMMLIGDGRHFVEASPFDKVWGIGFDKRHAMRNRDDWGQNLLGQCWDIVCRECIDRRKEGGEND